MAKFPKETLLKTESKRIGLDVWKAARGGLTMFLQEWDRNGDGTESFMIFQSWSVTVATTPNLRATQPNIDKFYAANIEKARGYVDARAKVLGLSGYDTAIATMFEEAK